MTRQVPERKRRGPSESNARSNRTDDEASRAEACIVSGVVDNFLEAGRNGARVGDQKYMVR